MPCQLSIFPDGSSAVNHKKHPVRQALLSVHRKSPSRQPQVSSYKWFQVHSREKWATHVCKKDFLTIVWDTSIPLSTWESCHIAGMECNIIEKEHCTLPRAMLSILYRWRKNEQLGLLIMASCLWSVNVKKSVYSVSLCTHFLGVRKINSIFIKERSGSVLCYIT